MVVRSQFRKLVTAGAGEVVGQRVRKAALGMDELLGIREIAYLDPRRPAFADELTPTLERFLPLPDKATAEQSVEVAATAGLLGPETLLLVCNPTKYHVDTARVFAPHVGRVAVEKPTAFDPAEVTALREFVNVFPLGHQMFKQEMRKFVADCDRRLLDVGQVAKVHFTMFESQGLKGRMIDQMIWDLAWHGFECAMLPFVRTAAEVGIVVHRADVSFYRDGPDGEVPGNVMTVARIEADLVVGDRYIPLLIRVGKGVGVNDKRLELFDDSGEVVREVSLMEGGHQAHGRMIEELWVKDTPDMLLGMNEVIGVVGACAKAERIQQVKPWYYFGDMPAWLLCTERQTPLARSVIVQPSAHTQALADVGV